MLNFLKKKTKFSGIKSILVDHIKQLNEKKDIIPKDILDVTRYSLEDILSTFESMDILMQKNNFEGCLKISRTILEHSVNLQYIYKEDTEKRAKNFKLKTAKALSEKFQAIEDKEIIPHARELNKVFENMLKEYTKDVSMRDKFKEIDSDAMYVRSYKRLSEYVHPLYRENKTDFNEAGPYVLEMKRTVMTDTSLVTLIALKAICERYSLDGGVIMLSDPSYIGDLFFATNPKNMEETENVKGKK